MTLVKTVSTVDVLRCLSRSLTVCSIPSDLGVGPADTAADLTLPGAKSWSKLGANVLFEKVLTSSDINPQGRIVVPKVMSVVLKTKS